MAAKEKAEKEERGHATFQYVGLDSHKVSRSGQSTEDPVSFARSRFEQGWQKLSMTRISDAIQIGGITRDAKKRIWWAEKWDPEPRCGGGLHDRIVTGYVGEDGIEANVAYRCANGKLVKAESA